MLRIAFLVIALVFPASALAGITGTASVIDGDTIRVTHDLKSVKVRLYGIDCPEIKQAGGKEARALIRRLAFGRVLLVESKGKEKYKKE